MQFCAFSKHFQSLDADQLGRTMRELGLDGVDLTVRRGGHVEPAQVKSALPAFQETLAKHDVAVTMLTTSITGADEPHAASVIETAARLGIGYIKLGYWHYEGFGHYRRQEAEVRAALKGLEPLLAENGVKAGLHTHSGRYMGPNAEFALRLIEDCDPATVGVYYDTGHCTLEGGVAGWLMGLDLVSDRLIMVAVKDLAFFRLGGFDGPRRGWRDMVVPMSAGLVDWPELIRCLKAMDFRGPLSFHCEYQGHYSFMDMTQEQVIEQTRKDLVYFRSLLAQ